MRILGIDYGTKRIGIAVSDSSGEFALPVSVVENGDGALKEIQEIAKKQETVEMVMGESLNYKQEPNSVHAESMKFKERLEDLGFIVHLEPEFMTSVAAERFQGKNEFHDASSAALILQSFIDKNK
jgi:putative Holliday junction resolvase